MKISPKYCLPLGLVLMLSINTVFAQTAPNISYSPSTNVYTVGTTIPTLTPTNSGGAVASFAYGTGVQLTGAALSNPYGMGIDASGNIYVANYGNNTISKYNSSGSYQGTYGSSQVSNPTGIAFDNSGNGYVLNYNRTNNGNGNTHGNAYVAQYNPAGTWASNIIQGLGTANGIAIDPSNDVYVAQGSYNGGNITVSQYNTGGGLSFSLSSTYIANPVGVATDGSGNIYVLDGTNNSVVKYNSTGTYISAFTTGLTSPLAIYADGAGDIYIGDSGAHTVTVYSNSGTVLTSLTGITDPEGIVTDKSGNLYVSDYTNNTVTKYPPVGGYSLSPTLPAGLSFDSTTGIFTGAPTAAFAATTYTVTASNAKGTGSTTVNLSCPNTSALNISYTPFSINVFTTNSAITNLTPTIGGSPKTYSISPAFPSNTLTFNTTTGIISGTPTATSAAALYTITCYDASNNSASTVISIACVIDDYWTGKNGTDWNDSKNWSVGIPAANDIASIGVQSYKKNDPIISTLDGAVKVNYLRFGAANQGATLTIQTGASLTVSNVLVIENDATPVLTATGTGAMNIAPNAAINVTGNGALTISSPLTFTLQSDVTGSAQVSQITTGSITGTVSVQRYITGNIANNTYRGYRLLSSPVNVGTQVNSNNVYSINSLTNNAFVLGPGGTTNGFAKTGNPSVFLYNESVTPSNASFTAGNFSGISKINNAIAYNYYVNNISTNYNLPVGNGFMFFYRGSSKQEKISAATIPGAVASNDTLTMTGTLNQGSITVHDWYNPTSAFLGYTGTGTGTNYAVRGFNLVGNPYACSIDWDTYSTTSSTAGIYASSITKYIYIIDPVSKNYNIYGAGNSGVGTIVTANSNIIPSGQGFFVQGTDASAALVFNEAAKTSKQATAANNNLLLGKPVQAAVSQFLNLKLIKDSVNVDGTIISFRKGAKPQYDINEDALYRKGNGVLSLFTTSSDGYDLAINSLPLPGQTPLQIALNVHTNTDGIYTLNLAMMKSIPELYDIWLMDTYKKDSLDIRNNKNYSFNITASIPATYGSSRFILVIRQNAAKGVHLLSFAAAKITGESQISWTTENEKNYTYFTVERSTDGGTTFNVLGDVTASAIGSYTYLDNVPVAGTDSYRLKIEDLNGTITYSDVVSLDYGTVTAKVVNASNIVVYPNPVGSTINLSIVQTGGPAINKPSYSIKVVNILGAVVKKGNTKTSTWQENASNLAAGTYVVQVVNTSDNSLVGKATFLKL